MTEVLILWAVFGGFLMLVAVVSLLFGDSYTRDDREEQKDNAVLFFAGLFLPLTLVAAIIYGLYWLITTALGKRL